MWTAIFLLIVPINGFAVVDYIDINNPFLRKIPIAVPLFQYLPESQLSKEIAEEGTSLLCETLEFTGFFKLLDRKAFLVDLQSSGVSGSSLNFKNWTAIGSELLITGGLRLQNNLIVLELRLFDTFNGRLLVGKKYKGWRTDLRKIVRRFCNEIMLRLTGQKGIFDSQIAFVSNSSGQKEIYICDYDGKNIQQVTNYKSIALSPSWSSDGKWLAFTSYKKNKPDLYIWNLEEKRGSVVAFKGINITPDWRPNRFSLAAALSKSGNSEIYLLTGTGKIVKRLTSDWGIDVSPSWSPDGKRIAFVSNRAGSAQIYIIDVNSDKIDRLTYEGQYNTNPSWSPKGDKIAFAGRIHDQFNIYVIDPDGSRLTQLTRHNGNNESPTWSPDGNLIAFTSTRGTQKKIYIMTSFGTDQRQLIQMPGEQFEPDWSP